MLKHRFRIIYLPEGRSSKKEFRFTPAKTILLGSIFGITLSLIIFLLISLTLILFPDYRVQALSRENRLLQEQIDQALLKVKLLGNQIDQLADSDAELRLKADLPLIDDATRQAGVGGTLISPGIDPAQDLQIVLEQLERQVEVQMHSYPQIVEKMEQNQYVVAHTPAVSPVDEIRLTSTFGWRRDPFTGTIKPHHGIDFGAPRGTPVKAPADGIVVMTKRIPTFGKVIVIDHGLGCETVYGHMQSFNVHPGQAVKRGQIIGSVGNTGRSTAPHLHYEVRINNEPVDPRDYIFFEDMVLGR